MADLNVTYQTGTKDHIVAVCSLCWADEWTFLPSDIEDGFATSPESLQIALHDGKLIGACMGSVLNDQQGFIDLLLVDAKFRRKGIGGKLLTKCLQSLGDRNVTLYCANDTMPFYQKFGLKPGEKPCNVYYRIFKPNKAAFKDDLTAPDIKLVSLKDLSFEKLHDYDMKIHLLDRASWLKDAIERFQSVAAVDSNGQICGFGILRVTPDPNNVYSFSPILADTPLIARSIMVHFLNLIPDGKSLELTVYKDNSEAMALVKELGLPLEKSAGYQAFTKKRFVVPVDKVYCIMQGSFYA